MAQIYNGAMNALAFSRMVEEIQSEGVKLITDYDFRQIEEDILTTQKQTLTEQFLQSNFDFTPANAFWLGLYNDRDKLVGVQASRLDDLAHISLAQHWRNQQPRIYGGVLGNEHAAVADEINGKVVYQGELWIDEIFRGNRISHALMKAGQLLANIQWQPDFIYAFFAEKRIQTGLHASGGFFNSQPNGTDWRESPNHINKNDHLVWNSATDVDRLAKLIVCDHQEKSM